MTEIGRMSLHDLARLSEMDPVEAAVTLRQSLGFAPSVCLDCGRRGVGRRRPGTTYVGCCNACGGQVELQDHS